MMRRPLVAILVLALVPLAGADVIRLKNGNVLEGKITVESAQEVRIRVGASEVSVPRAQVAEIERGESPHEAYKRRAAELKEGDAAGHYALAEFCLGHRMFTEAIGELRRTLELDSGHAEAKAKLRPLLDQRALPLLNQAKRLQEQGQLDEAEEPLIRILEQFPDSSYAALAQHHLALGFAARKQHDMALTRWRRALALDPGLLEAQEGAAQAAAETGRWADALAFTEQAIAAAKDPEHAKRLGERAEALRELAKLQQAPAEPGAASDSQRLAAEARVLLRLGQHGRAMERFQAAYDAGAREPEILRLLVEHNERQGNIRLALDAYKQLIAADPGDAALVRRRAALEQLLLVSRAFATRERAARERLLFEIARSGASFAAIQSALREATERPAEKAGLAEGQFRVDELLLPVSYVAHVPKNYDPRRPWPLILSFHRDGETAREHYYNWEAAVAGQGYIVLLPASPAKGGWRNAHLNIPLSALGHAMRVYNINTDRVYIEGTGTGGMLAWAAALRWPHRFAALAVRNAMIDEVTRLYLRAAVNLPVYLLVSQQGPADIVGSQREAYRTLDGWGYDVVLEEVPGYARNQALPELSSKLLAWFEGKSRNPYPPRLRLVSFEPANAAAYWVAIERFGPGAFDPDRRVAIRAPLGQEYSPEQLRMIYLGEIAKGTAQVIAAVSPGNRITIKTLHVEELTVFLDDKLVDLEKPVRIWVNGEAAFSGKVERSLEQLLDSARFHRDPRLCYGAAVRLKVRQQ